MFDFLSNIYDKAKDIGSNLLGKITGSTGKSLVAQVGEGMSPEAAGLAKNIVSGKLPGPSVVAAGGAPPPVYPDIGNIYNPKAKLAQDLAQSTYYDPKYPGGKSPAESFGQTQAVVSAAQAGKSYSVEPRTITPTFSSPSTSSSTGGGAPAGYDIIKDPITGQMVLHRQGDPIAGYKGEAGGSSVNLGSASPGTPGGSPLEDVLSKFFSTGAGPLGLVNSSGSGISPEDAKKLVEELKKNPGAYSTAHSTPAILGGTPPQTSWDQMVKSGLYGPVSVVKQPGVKREPALNGSAVPAVMNAGEIGKGVDTSRGYMGLPGAKSGSDMNGMAEDFSTKAGNYATDILSGSKLPKNPVVDTLSQQKLLDGLEPNMQFNVRGFMDEWRKANNVPQWESQKVETLANITAINKAYKDAVTEIKANPNLPKTLANRRIQAVQEMYKGQLDTLEGTLQQINATLENYNTALDRELGIQKTEYDMKKDQIANQWEQFKFLAQNGGLTEESASTWAQALGVSESQVNKIMANGGTGKFEYRDMGAGVGVFQNGKLLHTYGDVGGGSGSGLTSTQLGTGANNAGLSADAFTQLDPTVQTFYSRLTSTQKKDLDALVASIGNGSVTVEEAVANIDAKSMTPEVKAYLKNQVTKAAPAPKEDKGIWQSLKDWWNS